MLNLEKIFDPFFGNPENSLEFPCKLMISEVRCSLRTLFEENSKDLNSFQKDLFAEFLREFQDIFSEDLTSGNCEILEHVIKLKDSNPIK